MGYRGHYSHDHTFGRFST